jgi:hypothetical protein
MATIWTRVLRQLGLAAAVAPATSTARPRAAALLQAREWEARLIEAGVSDDWAPLIARRLELLHRELGPRATVPLLRAAVASYEAQAEAQTALERNLRDVREVERLLGAFSGELEKLDEVLEVLAAYAQRMRTKPGARGRQTLH